MNPVVGDKFGKMSIVGEVQSLNGRKWPVQCVRVKSGQTIEQALGVV